MQRKTSFKDLERIRLASVPFLPASTETTALAKRLVISISGPIITLLFPLTHSLTRLAFPLFSVTVVWLPHKNHRLPTDAKVEKTGSPIFFFFHSHTT